VLAVTVARLAALDVNTRRVIAAVALLTAPTVASVVAVVGDRAVDGLAEAAREGLLQINASAVLFAHPLLRSAAAATLSDGERRTLHRTLASVVSDPDERVAHEAAAAAGPTRPLRTRSTPRPTGPSPAGLPTPRRRWPPVPPP